MGIICAGILRMNLIFELELCSSTQNNDFQLYPVRSTLLYVVGIRRVDKVYSNSGLQLKLIILSYTDINFIEEVIRLISE